MLRTKGDLDGELGLDRPIVVTPLGTRLCRPKERVLEVLPSLA